MKKYIDLTEEDKKILNSYKIFLEGLSEYLGSAYEIILHSLEDIDESAIKVINGHYSGRAEGAPLTDLAMNMLSEILKSENNYSSMTYSNTSPNGTPLKSATIPVVGSNNKIIGLICFNFYTDIPLHVFLSEFTNPSKSGNQVVETFASNSLELIVSAVKSAQIRIHADPTITTSNKNKEIIHCLYEQDIFNIKDSVIKVAETLGISKNTVYMHIRNFAGEEK